MGIAVAGHKKKEEAVKLSPDQQLALDFKEYESYHGSFENKLTHYIGIPLIVVSLLGLLARLGITVLSVRVDAALLLMLSVMVFYFALEWKLALPFSGVVLAGYWVGTQLSLPLLWSVFVLGWVAQFLGHAVFEKRSPVFFSNLRHLLIGPSGSCIVR